MENIEQQELADEPGTTVVDETTLLDANDAAVIMDAKQEAMTSTKQENDAENDNDDKFGDFDAAIAPKVACEDEDGKEGEDESAAGGNDELITSTNDEFGASTTHAYTISDVQGENMEQEESPSDACDDPFSHLSTDATPDEADKVDVTEPAPVEQKEAATEENAVVSNKDEDSSSPDEDDVGYFSTHLKESESGIESSETGQDSLPDNDAGYFSAVDASGGDNNNGECDQAEKEHDIEKSLSMEEDNTCESDAPPEIGLADSADVPAEPALEKTESEKLSLSEKSVETERITNDEEVIHANDEACAGEDGTEGGLDTLEVTPAQPEDAEANSEEVIAEEAVATQTDDDADDEFGAFGSFEQVTEAVADTDTVEQERISVEIVEESNVDAVEAENDANEDDFGDFGSFEQATESAALAVNDAENDVGQLQSEEPAVVDDDDDFGDFGSFEQATEAPAISDAEKNVAGLPVGEPAAADDDDFGDFGSFEDAQVKSAEQTAEAPASRDDDDFGDFTDFASSGTPSEKAGESHSAPIEERPLPIATVTDPTITRAETVFSDVFGPGVLASENDGDVSERVVVKVNSALVS